MLSDLKERSREGAMCSHSNAYPGVWWSGFLQRPCKLGVTGWMECVCHSLDSLPLCVSLCMASSQIIHRLDLPHGLDMSPFSFVSFVTHRSACKVECNTLFSLSSQVSTLLFGRKHGHCRLSWDGSQPKLTVTLSMWYGVLRPCYYQSNFTELIILLCQSPRDH